MSDSLSVSNVKIDTTYIISNNTKSQALNKPVFGNVAEDVDKRNAEINEQIEAKKQEYAKLEERLKYLNNDSVAVERVESKEARNVKLAEAISGGAASIGVAAVGVTKLIGAAVASGGVVTAGVTLAFAATAVGAIVVGAAVGAGVAKIVKNIQERRHKDELVNRDAEKAQIEQQMQVLQKEMEQLRSQII